MGYPNEKNLNDWSEEVFESNLKVGWWTKEEVELLNKDKAAGKYSKPSATLIASKLALIHSEVSEALEGMRKGLMDDHLPDRTMFETELADVQIRLFDLVGACKLDLYGATKDKFEYNQKRADHKLANREAAGGKTI